MKYILITSSLVLLFSCVWSARATDLIDRRTVPNLDLERFAGHWYEIARYDHRFERNLQSVSTDYILRPDGKIEIINRGYDIHTGKEKVARGRAKATDKAGQLRVSFFLFFYSDYNILEIDEEYEWALIGGSSSNYLWILARKPQLDRQTLAYILRLAQQRGYSTSQLIWDQPARPNSLAR